MTKKEEMRKIEVEFTDEEVKKLKKNAKEFGFKDFKKYALALALGEIDVEHLKYGKTIRKTKGTKNGFVLPLDSSFVKSCNLKEGGTLYCYPYNTKNKNFMFVSTEKLSKLKISGKTKIKI